MAAIRRITLKEARALGITLQLLQVCYPDLDVNFELKTGLINLLSKYHRLPEEKEKEWFYTQLDEVITNYDLLRKEFQRSLSTSKDGSFEERNSVYHAKRWRYTL
ncbi:hypothetical protein AHAS_Ahas08G0047500 [Arachis hypogaea]